MPEIEWWEADSLDEFAASVAGDIGFIIESAIDARGQALLAFPGGPLAEAVYDKLTEKPLPWQRVTIFPTDERLVPVDDDRSIVAPIARHFLPRKARVLPLGGDIPDYRRAGVAADARLQDLSWPPDLVWLHVDDNGNTAGIFPGPDFDEAVEGPSERRALGVMPDPLPRNMPLARISLTRSAVSAARTVIVGIAGSDQKEAVEQGERDGAASSTPIGRVLAELTIPVDVHWLRDAV